MGKVRKQEGGRERKGENKRERERNNNNGRMGSIIRVRRKEDERKIE